MRIVAGRVKGHQLLSPKGVTRPTSGRVRKSLFDIIAGSIRERTVVDLCAGIGGLGIEALSRGAACVVFVDRDPGAVRIIRKNLELCRLTEQSAVWRADAVAALRYMSESHCRIDLLLADPPYGSPVAEKIVHTLGTIPLLRQDGLCIIEHHRDQAFDTAGNSLTLVRRRHIGDTALSFFQIEYQHASRTLRHDVLPLTLPHPGRRVER